jgi:hypothetical protein
MSVNIIPIKLVNWQIGYSRREAMKIAKYDYIKGLTSLQYIYSPPPVDPASLWANPASLRANSGSMGANYRGRKGADNRARAACPGINLGLSGREYILLIERS